jgi:hypothetical protein
MDVIIACHIYKIQIRKRKSLYFHFPKTLVRRDHRLLHEYQDLSFLRDP